LLDVVRGHALAGAVTDRSAEVVERIGLDLDCVAVLDAAVLGDDDRVVAVPSP
jgi:hypothetical protein